MNTKILLPFVYVLITCIATVFTNEDIIGDSDFGRSLRHHIVKRKVGGRGRRGKSSRGHSKSQPNYPYPKQQYGQPGQPANTGFNQRQPAHNPNYPTGGQQPGYGYPGYGNTGQQHGINNMGKAGGIGGVLGGAGGLGGGMGHGIGKSRGMGMGGMLGGAALGGLGGAVLGSVAGYQLGKAVGNLGRHGHYGYWDSGHYHPCEPPSRIDYNPQNMERYIPHDIRYNERCRYMDASPSRYYGYFDNNRFIRCELPKVEMNPLTNETYVNYGQNFNNRCRYYERDPLRYPINTVEELYPTFDRLIVELLSLFILL